MSEPNEAPVKERGFFQSTLVRVTLALVLIGIIAVVVAVVALYSYRSSRNKPLAVDIYPGAERVLTEEVYDGFDHQRYMVTASLDEVDQFYTGQDDMECERQYGTVTERLGEEPLREGHNSTRCVIDRSGWGVSQFTTVIIQPDVDANGVASGQIVIDVQRHWGD